MDIQTRYIKTLATDSMRPYYKVLCPDTWTDEQIKAAFMPHARRWVGHLAPRGRRGCTGGHAFPVVGTLWLGLDVATMRGLLDEGGERDLLDIELVALVEAAPELAPPLRAEMRRRAAAEMTTPDDVLPETACASPAAAEGRCEVVAMADGQDLNPALGFRETLGGPEPQIYSIRKKL